MSTVTETPVPSAELADREPITDTGRLFTVEDLSHLPCELPSGRIDFELDNGRLVPMVLPGDSHGAAQSKIAAELFYQGEKPGHGKVRTAVGVILWRDPDRVVGPDVLFVGKDSQPIKASSEGYLETRPDLVVEIRSKNDTLPYVQRKVDDYFEVGVKQVWIVDPAAGNITIHQPGSEPQVFTGEQALPCPLIPDFQLTVADVLRE